MKEKSKKLLKMFAICFMALISCFTLFACGETPDDGGDKGGSGESELQMTLPAEDVFVWEGDTITDLTSAGNGLELLVIPDTLGGNTITKIAYGALDSTRCTTLKISANIVDIGEYGRNNRNTEEENPFNFTQLGKITKFVVDSNNTKYKAINGVLYSKDETVLIAYPAGIIYASVVVPSGVTRIMPYAFYGCQLASVTLPSTLTTIGNSAFLDCEYLSSVTFDGVSSLTKIGNSAFQYCEKVTEITIPASVTVIGIRAFADTGLTSATFEETEGWQKYDNIYKAEHREDSLGTITMGISGVYSLEYENALMLKLDNYAFGRG